ncbi:MAG: chromate transporter [Caldisericia bacterium]|jgi:chromate transporter|nr:chromate transporter [Caldisericia bacterium]
MKKFNLNLSLFLTFLKIGALTFGGGYAMIGILKEEIVERKKWLTEKEFLEITAIAEMTPGPIAINMATFIGRKFGGFIGAFFATIGVVLPSFVIILTIAIFSGKLLEYTYVKSFMNGVIIAIVAQLTKVSFNFIKSIKKTILTITIFFASLLCALFLNISVFYIILASGLIGIILERE